MHPAPLRSDSGVHSRPILTRGCAGGGRWHTDWIAEEQAVAMVYNGISHAVMMATPLHLQDFALGFSLSEGIIEAPAELRDIEVVASELGFEARMDIAPGAFMRLKRRRRQLSGRTGCGLCGLESLHSLKPQARAVPRAALPEYRAVEKAVQGMRERQAIQSLCGAVHAAAYVSAAGDIVEIREDVGRHNALDKLLGALAGRAVARGFALVSSRASFEMVTKAASRSLSTLVSISAPTTLAITLAESAGMNLIGFVRAGRQVVYCRSAPP